MTLEEARLLIVEGINYAAYKETDSSLHDSDKNRLLGAEHYNSGRIVVKPSPWAGVDFEEKMAMLLGWANVLNRSDPAFGEARRLLGVRSLLLVASFGKPRLVQVNERNRPISSKGVIFPVLGLILKVTVPGLSRT